MSALLDPPTVKRDRTDSDAPRAKLSNLPYGTDEASVRSFIVSTNVAVTSLLVKNNGRVAIATLPDDAALQAILTLNGSVLGDRPIKVGRYFGAGDRPPAKKPTDETVAKATATTSDEDVVVDAAGNVTYTLKVADREIRFAVGVREESVQSLAKDAIAALELFDMTPGARVLVAATSKDADAAIKALREALTKGAGRVQGIDVVGFDTETKPVFVAGRPPNDVALVQLAVRGLIVLVRLDLIGGMPDSLRRLLEDASVLKCRRRMRGRRTDAEQAVPGPRRARQLPGNRQNRQSQIPELESVRPPVARRDPRPEAHEQGPTNEKLGAALVHAGDGPLRGQRRRGGAALSGAPL